MNNAQYEIQRQQQRSLSNPVQLTISSVQHSQQEARPLRILIVEDDVSLKKVIKRSFKMLDKNIEVKWITSADQFLSDPHHDMRVDAKSFDLVLTDINMPGVSSGFEVWNHFTQLDPKIPVVIMSGLSEHDFGRAMGDTTAINYMQKPMSLAKCAAVLDLHFQGPASEEF
ncbi:MAG: response regulator [Bdellovibrionota bacterium]